MEIRDFSNHCWYDADIIITEFKKSNLVIDELSRRFNVEDVKDCILFVGKNSEMRRSDLYKHLLRRDIISFGTIDGYIIIVIC